MSAYRYFTTTKVGEATVATPVDPHLQGTALAELVRHEMLKIVENEASQFVIVDFRNVKLVSSSVISSLLGIRRQLAAGRIPLLLCGMSDSLRHVFRTLNLDGTIFTIVDTVEDAIAAPSSSSLPSYYDICGRVSPPDEESP